MKTRIQLTVGIIMLFSIATTFAQTVNWLQYLQSQTAPHFRQGNTMYPLTIFGSGTNLRDLSTYTELANKWGYALEFTNAWNVNPADTNNIKSVLNNPNSYEYKIIQLAKSNPEKYKLYLPVFQFQGQGMVPLAPEDCPDCYCHDASGDLLYQNGFPVLNPIMTETSLTRCGKALAWPFKYIERQFGVKASMGIHQGEAACWDCWDNDPKVIADRGTQDRYLYRDKKFNRIIKGFYSPVQTALRTDGLFVYYVNGGHWDKNRYGGWITGVPAYFDQTKESTVLPNQEHYWYSFNTGGDCDVHNGSSYNFLTKYLASTGDEIAQGNPYSYEWTSPGWASYYNGDSIWNSPMDMWTGALKSMYTGGMLGNNIGYYGYDNNYPATFDAAKPPLYVRQALQGSRVHALFTWIEPFVRNSDLLPGPYMHVYSGFPAYEFIKQTNSDGSPIANCGARVMARKHKTSNEWLICAWNHNGADRNVTVTIPILGSVIILARKTGTLYHAKLNGTVQELSMLDNDGMVVTIDTTLLKNKYSPIYSTPNVVVTGVSINPATATIQSIGITQQLSVVVTPTNAFNKFVTWKSSNTAIAWVSPSGVVTAVASGNVTITVTTVDGNKTATCNITINNIPVSVNSISLKPLSSGMDVGDQLPLVATIAPENASNKNIYWTSSNEAVAKVTSAGIVVAVGAGTAVITATTEDGIKTATTNILVTPYAGGDGLTGNYFNNLTLTGGVALTRVDTTINFNWGGGSPHINVSGDNFTIRWTGMVQPIYSQEYTFYTYTDDAARLWVNDVLIIDNWKNNNGGSEASGKITLQAGFMYSIKMEYSDEGHSAVARLSWSSLSQSKQIIRKSRLFSTNQNFEVTNVSVIPATVTININATQQLVSLIVPTNASNKNVSWSSLNTSVATVNTSGLVTGLALGTALIVATTVDGNKKDTSIITVNNTVTTSFTVFTTQVPTATDNDGDYELGMKFRSIEAGYITKIRYYKPIGETGSHTGRIWSATGTQLASVLFTGESANGWQEMALAMPLSILANTTYIVSVNANTVYAITANGLQSSITNGYLSSVADGVNGVYNETIGLFPIQSYSNTNYFRDVVYASTTATEINGLKNSEIKIYPNPTNGILYIQAPEKTIVEIFSLTGVLVYFGETKKNNEIIDLSGKKGIFLLKIKGKSVQIIIQ